MKKIPTSLRVWFVIHFVADMIFGIPLLLYPVWVLGFFGIDNVEMLTARLVGAALIGIGGVSLLVHKKGIETYQALLSLKLIWASAAIVAIILSLLQGAPENVCWILRIFIIFWGVWAYYKWQLSK